MGRTTWIQGQFPDSGRALMTVYVAERLPHFPEALSYTVISDRTSVTQVEGHGIPEAFNLAQTEQDAQFTITMPDGRDTTVPIQILAPMRMHLHGDTEFAAAGAWVSLLARSRELVEKVAGEVGGQGYPVDLATTAELPGVLARVERHVGPVDVLVNNAVLGEVRPFVDQSADSVTDHVNVNLLAPMQLSKLVLPGMLQRSTGGLITISSLSSEISIRNMTAYTATKAGLTAFALNLQRELSRAPVRTMLVVLGEVQTDMVTQGREDPVLAAIADRLGSMGSMTPDRVAHDIVTGYQRGRTTHVLPPAARPIFEYRQLPNRIFDVLTRSVS